jgi:L-lactate dehydrogenase complex protein LldG
VTTSKEFILKSVRRHRPSAAELPDLNQAWTTYEDRRRQFIEVLTAIGGHVETVATIDELNEHMRSLPATMSAQKIVSLVPGAGEPNVDLAVVASPHALADVDVAIMPGQFAVAENGAVWVTDHDVAQRVIYFLCQHLVLVVPASAIVDNMHTAYERLNSVGDNGGSIFAQPLFGTFIAGPSKTADIEQSLVIGAHGARSLTVYLLD